MELQVIEFTQFVISHVVCCCVEEPTLAAEHRTCFSYYSSSNNSVQCTRSVNTEHYLKHSYYSIRHTFSIRDTGRIFNIVR